jgi:Ca2+-binding EF-hand superfamily protein
MIAAFKALDQNQFGFLRFTQFLRLFKVLYPRVDVEQVNLIFNSLDEDNTKKIG